MGRRLHWLALGACSWLWVWVAFMGCCACCARCGRPALLGCCYTPHPTFSSCTSMPSSCLPCLPGAPLLLHSAPPRRYVTPGAFFESARAAGLSEADIAAGDQRRILQARWYLYQPGGAMARELAKNPTVLVVNNIVFAHGGLLPHHLKYGLQVRGGAHRQA